MTNIAPEKKNSGKGDSYWKPPFSRAMLVSGSVTISWEKEAALLAISYPRG